MHQPTSRPQHPQPQHPHLDPALQQALDDLADATGQPPEALVRDAVRRYLVEQGAPVLAAAERLAVAHGDLLRRLGE
ncbi:ribbon-helix-helix protein, CopG family [Streptomyces sp. NPDC050528]|uniref:ribbon-helix-helix protein, CopG family n=1 Tax=Streptomyces sp. NPDC050528 TaxID=3365623 RepID=UPI0037A1CCF7